MTTDQDIQDVKEMLERRARSIEPRRDGLERIEAKLAAAPVVAPSRRLPMPLLAAAAVVVIALVGAVFVAQRDDTTTIDTPLTTAPVSPNVELPLGVWPWPGDDVDESVLDEPDETARAYVESRVPGHGTTAELGVETGDDSTVQIVISGAVSTTVFLRNVGDRWHVESASSDLVTLHDAGDGTTTARVETGGVLTRSVERGPESSFFEPPETVEVQGGEEYPGLAYDLNNDRTVVRHRFVLDTGDATIALTEISFRPPSGAEASTVAGVWPWAGDAIDPAVLDDPVDTARAYVASRIVELGATTDSGYLAGDANSGEVVFSGDVSTTVLVRNVDGRWHVVAAVSDLLTLEVQDDGGVAYTAHADGQLTAVSDGPDLPADPRGPVPIEAGSGGSYGPGDAEPFGTVRHRYVLEAADGTTVLAEAAHHPATSEEPAQPTTDGAIELGVWPWPSDDVDDTELRDPETAAHEFATQWLGGSQSTRHSGFRATDAVSGVVVYEDGDLESTVQLRRDTDDWFVVDATTAAVQAIPGGTPGELRLIAQEPGTLMVEIRSPETGVVSSMPDRGVSAGEEVLVVPPAETEPGEVLSVRYALQTQRVAPESEFNVAAMGEQRVQWQTSPPADAVWNEGSSDARDLTVRYLDDRLAGRDVVVNEAVIAGDTAEVSWEAGVVLLERVAGSWYVVEAIGDSVQIETAAATDDGVRGELRLAQAGAVRVTADGHLAEVRNDIDREGTFVVFSIVPAATPTTVLAVFETDTGFVSLAERYVAE